MPCTWINFIDFFYSSVCFSLIFISCLIHFSTGLTQNNSVYSGFNKTLVQLLKVNMSVYILVSAFVFETNEWEKTTHTHTLISGTKRTKWKQSTYGDYTTKRRSCYARSPVNVGTIPFSWRTLYEFMCLCAYSVAFQMMTLPMQWNFQYTLHMYIKTSMESISSTLNTCQKPFSMKVKISKPTEVMSGCLAAASPILLLTPRLNNQNTLNAI